MADRYNICIDQNATWVRQFTWLDSTGTPIDLTDYTVESQIRIASTSPTASAQFDVFIATPPTSGSFLLSLDPTSSLALTGSCYVYDVLATSGTFQQRIVEGKAVIDSAVTR